MKNNNYKDSKRGFWNTGFSSFLIIMFAFFFAFGMTCTIWKLVTNASSVVSDGNVFGYSIVDVHSNSYSPTFKAGDTAVVHHTNLENATIGGMIVYNVSNDGEMQYDVAKLISVDNDEHTMVISDLNGTHTKNASLYVGTVLQVSSLTEGIVQVVNSNIMIWLFDVAFGVILVTLLICRRRAKA